MKVEIIWACDACGSPMTKEEAIEGHILCLKHRPKLKINVQNLIALIKKGNVLSSRAEFACKDILYQVNDDRVPLIYSTSDSKKQSYIDLLVKDDWLQIKDDKVQFSALLKTFIKEYMK